MIIKCLCQHPDQDRIHGLGNRVMNPTKDPTRARCTSCKSLVSVTKSNIDIVTNNSKKKGGKR